MNLPKKRVYLGTAGADISNVVFIAKMKNDRKYDSFMILPFFPESVSDSKGASWNSIELPGASHPLYQFVNSGERVISFTAKLLRETKPKSANRMEKTESRTPYDVDINSAVKFLRSCLYPKIAENLMEAPPICNIKIGGSQYDQTDSGMITCVMTQCDIESTKWWDDRDGTPRFAEVSLSFTEIINAFGKVEYIDRDRIMSNSKIDEINRL